MIGLAQARDEEPESPSETDSRVPDGRRYPQNHLARFQHARRHFSRARRHILRTHWLFSLDRATRFSRVCIGSYPPIKKQLTLPSIILKKSHGTRGYAVLRINLFASRVIKQAQLILADTCWPELFSRLQKEPCKTADRSSRLLRAKIRGKRNEERNENDIPVPRLAKGSVRRIVALAALRHNPHSIAGLTNIAGIASARQNYLTRENGDVWSALGHCFLMKGDLQNAYSTYRQALYYLPNPKLQDPRLWYGIRILYDRYGSLEHLEEAFSSVLRMDQDFNKANEIFFRLGIIYKQQQKYEEAFKCFERICGNPPLL
ncbi:TPR-like protein [Rhizoctonia solani AG-3 Rhs1AP]|uniref:TPR-like protein n=2 Tax=Rhizoctonia solani AG-3 TaxID=1086053 RepID=A0A074RRH7_9AGAM|nr:TPR-like protein [Rhizoctonia solani AG-3 Rhs1AP]KEP47243.1 TPR-like protein [Rhizoctonia solani 123E]